MVHFAVEAKKLVAADVRRRMETYTRTALRLLTSAATP